MSVTHLSFAEAIMTESNTKFRPRSIQIRVMPGRSNFCKNLIRLVPYKTLFFAAIAILGLTMYYDSFTSRPLQPARIAADRMKVKAQPEPDTFSLKLVNKIGSVRQTKGKQSNISPVI